MIEPESIPLQQIMMFLVVVAVVAFVGLQVVDAATSAKAKMYVEQSEQWCQGRNGELYNARVIGSHGGLHCELPNGTTVHMDNVVEVNAAVLENQTQ